MNYSQQTGCIIRRATTEDLPRLIELWKLMRFPAEELARRVTEFQIVEDASGELVGAAGMEIAERQGRLHSEGFIDFSMADKVRPLIWERIRGLATNHGLLNLWTQEQVPFWKHTFDKPGPELMEKLPGAWRNLPGGWLGLKLREDIDAVLAMDKEFAAFMQSQKARTKQTLHHAKMIKLLATFIAAAVLILVMLAGWYIVRHNPSLR